MHFFAKIFLLAFFLNPSISIAAINDYVYKNGDIPSFQ